MHDNYEYHKENITEILESENSVIACGCGCF